MKKKIFPYIALTLLAVTTTTGCDGHSENPMPDNAIRVTTAEVTAITSENAISGGQVAGEVQTVSEFGICWATTDNPTISGSHNVGAGEASSFACYVTGLSANTTYYVRAYATTPEGTVYGQSRRFMTLAGSDDDMPLSAGMMVRTRWPLPFICGRKTIWQRSRTTQAVKGLTRTRHRSVHI